MKIDRKSLGIPYPQVWHRFEVHTANGHRKFKVQDLTDDLFEEAVKLLLIHFTNDEPPCKHIEINKHPKAVAELEKLWRETLDDQLSVVCLLEDDSCSGRPVIAGLNVLTVARVDDKVEPFKCTDKVWSQLFGAVDLVSHGVDVYQHYGVDQYLTAFGLIVLPEFRGNNIGMEILKARIPMCKAFGLKVTATVFTAAASQTLARKAGFETLYEIEYTELAKRGFIFPGVESSTKSSKLMALVIE